MSWPLLDIAARTLANDYEHCGDSPPRLAEARIDVRPNFTPDGLFFGWTSYRLCAVTLTPAAS